MQTIRTDGSKVEKTVKIKQEVKLEKTEKNKDTERKDKNLENLRKHQMKAKS